MKIQRQHILAVLLMLVISMDTFAYKKGMTMLKPAEGWREGLPSGNGKIAALVYGNISTERVLFNHNELWYGGKKSDLPDMSQELPVVRKLMDEGKYQEANEYYKNKMRASGFNARNARYHPAFDMILTTETKELFQDYKRTLDFESGESEVSWKDGDVAFSRKLFVSITEDISVMSITTNKSNAITGELTLDIHDLKDAIMQNGKLYDPGFVYTTKAEGDFVVFTASGSDGGEFGGVLRIINKGGTTSASNYLGKENTSIAFDKANELLLLVDFFANEASAQAVPRLKKRLLSINESYQTLLGKHKALHSKRFNAMGININPDSKGETSNEYLLLDAYQHDASKELVQKLFEYGRYLLISSSRANGYPANLQGIWNGDYMPPWSSLYGNNENLQMTYWQGLPGNLKESMLAFYDYFDAHLDQFRYNAKQLYGCRGIYIPPFMSPESGVMRHTAPHVVYWTDAAGWLASFYYDYYLFTGDEVFLKERAIPFMKEVALFYEDYIVKDSKGKNILYPAQSPENQPLDKIYVDEKTGRTNKVKVQINSTIAVAIAKEVFSNLIEACGEMGIEKKGIATWKKLLKDMPEYEINDEGAFKEWLHPDFKDNYEHRHMSHIYPLFPGHEITKENNPAFYEACKVAIKKRVTIGLKSQTGWSLAHMANINARLGDGDKAIEPINILTRTSLGQNFFTYHNDWRHMGATLDFFWGKTSPFQMDANFGISAAVQEMLCGSEAQMLRLFPALPSAWDKGSFHDMLARTGTKVSAQWEGKTVKVQLVAERENSFDVAFPKGFKSLAGKDAKAFKKSKYGENYRKLSLKKGQSLDFEINL